MPEGPPSSPNPIARQPQRVKIRYVSCCVLESQPAYVTLALIAGLPLRCYARGWDFETFCKFETPDLSVADPRRSTCLEALRVYCIVRLIPLDRTGSLQRSGDGGGAWGRWCAAAAPPP